MLINRQTCQWQSPPSLNSPVLLSRPISDRYASPLVIEQRDFHHHGNVLMKFSSSSIDYHTTKRIEQLHERLDDIQIANFIKFINHHLAAHPSIDRRVEHFVEDLADGLIFIDLIEIFSSLKLKRESGRTRFHSLSNVQRVLDYLKLDMAHINISPHEIVSGNRKQILGLLWIIMKRFNFPSFRLNENKQLFFEQTIVTSGHDRSVLLRWLNALLHQIYKNETRIKDFYMHSWLEKSSDLIEILKYLSPLSRNYSTDKFHNYLEQLHKNDLPNDERWKLCWNLSAYLFHTNNVVIHPKDRTEKHLLRYFSELYQYVLDLLETDSLERVHNNHPHKKLLIEQLLKTIGTKYSQEQKDDEGEYLVFSRETSADDALPIEIHKIDTTSATDEGASSNFDQEKKTAKTNPQAMSTRSMVTAVIADPLSSARGSSSKRTQADLNYQQKLCSSAGPTPMKSSYTTRSTRVQDKHDLGTTTRLDSESEDVYSARSRPERRNRDQPDDDLIITHPKRANHRLPTVNNSAVRSQQEGMGDFSLPSNNKLHKNRSRTHRKSQRYTDGDDQIESNDRITIQRWRILIYVIIICILTMCLYRCLQMFWPKPRRTWSDRLIDQCLKFFTW